MGPPHPGRPSPLRAAAVTMARAGEIQGAECSAAAAQSRYWGGCRSGPGLALARPQRPVLQALLALACAAGAPAVMRSSSSSGSG